MNITDLTEGDRCLVDTVSCPADLQERLFSLHIRSGEPIKLLKRSFFRKTFLVLAGGSKIALGKEVAACISVKKI